MELLPLAIAGASALIGGAGLVLMLARSRKAEGEALNDLAEVLEKQAQLETRFAAVVDADSEVARVREMLAREKAEAEREISSLRSDSGTLRSQYAVAFQRHKLLEAEVGSLEEDLESIAVGLYKPHFTYEDSEAYKDAIREVRDRQKQMIRLGAATRCAKEWSVGGSRAEGQRMTKQYEKLVLRAFNAESDAAVANVSWNNCQVMQSRIEKAFDTLGKLGSVMDVSLTPQYRDTRLDELRLVFEAAEKKQKEREEQRRLRAEQREEERVQRELEKERVKAEQEEEKYEKALEKARAELAESIDAEREAMLARVQALEADLAAAHSRKERAIAQAQLTKVGHVYVISNIGAFGDGVLKIGLTRRLDPEERVKELGDASVPFPFDLHALIYSEDAPALEARLHNHFWEKRLNWANDRKEFFRTSLDDVNGALKELGLEASLLTVPEAREYRETLAAVERGNPVPRGERPVAPMNVLPEDPFDGANLA